MKLVNNKDLYYFERLKAGDENAFDYFFNQYYPGLLFYANKFVNNSHLAEEIVQSVFLKLWKDRKLTEINISVRAYLFQAVRNKCLDILKHKKIKDDYSQKLLLQIENTSKNDTWETYIESELYNLLTQAIEKLPGECQKIFRLSRIKQYKNKEIAEKLNLSIRTVENQISKALKILRVELKDYINS